MEPAIVGQLRVESHGQDVPLPDGYRVAVDLGEHLHAVAGLLDPGRADEDRVQGLAFEVELRLERRKLATKRVTADTDIENPEMLPVQHDHSRTGAQHRPSTACELDERLAQTLPLHAKPDGGRLAARNYKCVDALEILPRTDLPYVDVEARQAFYVSLEAALQRKYAD